MSSPIVISLSSESDEDVDQVDVDRRTSTVVKTYHSLTCKCMAVAG